MKILYSSNISWSIYNFRKSLLEELKNDNYEIYTIALEDDYSLKLKKLGFRHFNISINNNSKNPIEDIKLFLQYIKLYKRIKPDIICHNAIKPNIYGTIAAKILGIPVINNISGLGTLFISKSFSTALVKKMYKFSQKFANTVFFQNPHDLSLFVNEDLIDSEKASLIPGSGVDTNLFKPIKKERGDVFIFIFIGRFLKDKGILELYGAVNKLSETRKDFRVILVGSQYTSNETSINSCELDLFKKNNFFDVVGHSDHVQNELAKADCLILPSYREGLSKVLIEAGSSGIPCITTNVPGCKDVISDDYNGFIIEPRSSKSLVIAMLKMLNLNNKKLYKFRENSRKNVLENFSMKKVNNIYINEIKKVLKK